VFLAQVLVPLKSKLIEERSREFVGKVLVCMGGHSLRAIMCSSEGEVVLPSKGK
jgi:hypothetical protein